jgi:hypothetical protein
MNQRLQATDFLKGFPMPRLDWLAHHMHHSDTFASWIHQQFDYEYADQPLPRWQREFADGQTNGHWQCLIAQDVAQRWPWPIWLNGLTWALGWLVCSSHPKREEKDWPSV